MFFKGREVVFWFKIVPTGHRATAKSESLGDSFGLGSLSRESLSFFPVSKTSRRPSKTGGDTHPR